MSASHKKVPTPRYDELRRLLPGTWPRASFVLCGSAALAARGVRDVNDLDVLIKPDMCDAVRAHFASIGAAPRFENDYGDSTTRAFFAQYIIGEPDALFPSGRKIDFFSVMPLVSPKKSEAVFAEASTFDGYQVVSLRHCLAVKALANRAHDTADMVTLALLIDQDSRAAELF